jgi:hypothetical protein
VPVLPPKDSNVQQGVELLEQPLTLDGAGAKAFPAGQLPDASCSKQWTLSFLLAPPAAAGTSGAPAAQLPLVAMGAEAGAQLPAGYPGLSLRTDGARSWLVVTWGPGGAGARERLLEVSKVVTAGGKGSLHVTVVRAGNRWGCEQAIGGRCAAVGVAGDGQRLAGCRWAGASLPAARRPGVDTTRCAAAGSTPAGLAGASAWLQAGRLGGRGGRLAHP